MATTKLRLTDKEIEAIGKKMAQKANAEIEKSFAELANKKIGEAKNISTILKSLPSKVLDALYSNRYSRGQFTPTYISCLLVEENKPTESFSKGDFESEIVLKAHDCKTLGELCKKLGI